ncbi:calcium-binding protein, partial [Pseudomonas aeruginosa]|uniref:calcium-binding protein n=1 Tax=Pseudomonas aeruginosa TaxID=287 RepID=UPI0037F98B89
DYLQGEAGNDVYRFDRGWGQDTVYNYDSSTSRVDAIEFGTGIRAEDITLSRNSDDLILLLKGSTDRITISSYFNQDAAGSYRLEEIRFVDGQVLNIGEKPGPASHGWKRSPVRLRRGRHPQRRPGQ